MSEIIKIIDEREMQKKKERKKEKNRGERGGLVEATVIIFKFNLESAQLDQLF